MANDVCHVVYSTPVMNKNEKKNTAQKLVPLMNHFIKIETLAI